MKASTKMFALFAKVLGVIVVLCAMTIGSMAQAQIIEVNYNSDVRPKHGQGLFSMMRDAHCTNGHLAGVMADNGLTIKSLDLVLNQAYNLESCQEPASKEMGIKSKKLLTQYYRAKAKHQMLSATAKTKPTSHNPTASVASVVFSIPGKSNYAVKTTSLTAPVATTAISTPAVTSATPTLPVKSASAGKANTSNNTTSPSYINRTEEGLKKQFYTLWFAWFISFIGTATTFIVVLYSKNFKDVKDAIIGFRVVLNFTKSG